MTVESMSSNAMNYLQILTSFCLFSLGSNNGGSRDILGKGGVKAATVNESEQRKIYLKTQSAFVFISLQFYAGLC